MSTDHLWPAPGRVPAGGSRARVAAASMVLGALFAAAHAWAPQPLGAAGFAANAVLLGLLTTRLVEDGLTLTPAERLMLRVAAPVVLLVLGGLAADALPGVSLGRLTWAAVVGAGVELAAVAVVRKASQAGQTIIGQVVMPPWAMGMVAVLAVLPVVTTVISIHSEENQPRPPFTALSVARVDGGTVRVQVTSDEDATTGYQVRITSDGRPISAPIDISVQPGAIWQGDIDQLDGRPVDVQLFRSDQSGTPYRSVHLAAAPAPATPTASPSPSAVGDQ